MRWVVVSDPTEVKTEVVRYFSTLFSSTLCQSPLDEELIRSVISCYVSTEEAQRLSMTVSLDEIGDDMFQLGMHKATGPDGYSVKFFRASWDTIGEQLRPWYLTSLSMTSFFDRPMR